MCEFCGSGPVCAVCGRDDRSIKFVYSRWRHGGWYVHNVRYPSGACGCVSRNYTDGKWRIVTLNTGPGSPDDRTFPNRDAAARAELAIVRALRSVNSANLQSVSIG